MAAKPTKRPLTKAELRHIERVAREETGTARRSSGLKRYDRFVSSGQPRKVSSL